MGVSAVVVVAVYSVVVSVVVGVEVEVEEWVRRLWLGVGQHRQQGRSASKGKGYRGEGRRRRVPAVGRPEEPPPLETSSRSPAVVKAMSPLHS